jgi:hypothetical protein
MEEEKWPEQPDLRLSSETQHEEKPIRKIVSFFGERQHDEFDELLVRRIYWSTIRITAWILRYKYNLRAKKSRIKKRRGPLTADEMLEAQNCWIWREQKYVPHDLEQPGWSLAEYPVTKVLKCQGRIPNYTPVYLEDGLFVRKLIMCVHENVMHLGIASTIAEIRRNWWIPHLRSLVKRHIHDCNVCKVFAAKPLKPSTIASLMSFRLEAVRPFQHTGVDFGGPLIYHGYFEYGKILFCRPTKSDYLARLMTDGSQLQLSNGFPLYKNSAKPRIRVSPEGCTLYINGNHWWKCLSFDW